ncbi:hypothetical protein BDV95DRAFT_591418 [Massariosphaeria phaeospora]|uniref:Uncharacterized protein n=1 Tax=Massariosphaeria phaeospora TaxID=100035 RepID=A0A7C8MSN8_9PLEO|nr:hypothetical protein BDV95DRAFT_591418 [Massariosphaeria phaeospora]
MFTVADPPPQLHLLPQLLIESNDQATWASRLQRLARWARSAPVTFARIIAAEEPAVVAMTSRPWLCYTNPRTKTPRDVDDDRMYFHDGQDPRRQPTNPYADRPAAPNTQAQRQTDDGILLICRWAEQSALPNGRRMTASSMVCRWAGQPALCEEDGDPSAKGMNALRQGELEEGARIPPGRPGIGDASHFDKYPEETEAYGQTGGDRYVSRAIPETASLTIQQTMTSSLFRIPPGRPGIGDTSQFDKYPEETEAYGQTVVMDVDGCFTPATQAQR